MRLRRRRAGRSGIAIWRAKRRQAFRDAWRLNLASLALVAGCTIAIAATEGGEELVAAAIIGAMLTVHATVWSLGGHVSSIRWMQGAWGEQQTEEQLDRLGEGWCVVHDVSRERGNWDHIVVGQAGVFMIETKWTAASAHVAGDQLCIGRRVSYSGGGFRGAAVDLRNTIGRITGRPPWVTAVVAVWGEFEPRHVEGDRVTYLHGSLLGDWLEKQPTKLTKERARELSDAVAAVAQPPIASAA